MSRRLLAVFVFAVLAGACAAAGTASGPGVGDQDRNRLTSAQIEEAGLPNAYELVSRLRRAWLRNDPVTGGPVVVYMDDQELGGAEELRQVPAVSVSELQLVGNDEATMRWNRSIAGSVIVVIPRR